MGFLGVSDDSSRSGNDARSSTTSSSDDTTDSVSQNARDTVQQKKSVHSSSDDSESDGESQPVGNSLRKAAEPARNAVAQGTPKTLTQPSSVLASPNSEGEESSDKQEEKEEKEEEQHMAKSSQKRARQDEDDPHTVSKRSKKNEAEAPASDLPANPKSPPSAAKRKGKKSATAAVEAAENEVRSTPNDEKSKGKRKRKELQPDQEQDNTKSGPLAVSMATPASKKIVPHMWSGEDETTLLKCILELRKKGIHVPPGYGELHEFAAPRLQFRDVDRLQVRSKVGRMRSRLEKVSDKMEGEGVREEDFKFKNDHEAKLFQLWKQAWGNSEDTAMVDFAANKNSSESKGKGNGKDKAKDTAEQGNDKEKAADQGKDKEKTKDTTEKRKGKDKAKDSAEHGREKHVDAESKAKVKGKDIELKDKDNVKVAAQGSGEDAAEKLKDKEKKKIKRKGRSNDEDIADQQQQQHTAEALSPPVNSTGDAIGDRVEPSEANTDRDVVSVPNNINVHGDGNDNLEEDGTAILSEPELEALSKGKKALEEHANEIEAIGTRVGLMYDELTSFSKRLLLIRQECDKHVEVIRSFTRHEP